MGSDFKSKRSFNIFVVILISLFILLTLFSLVFHNHDILEEGGYDCPFYLISSQSLMSVTIIFTLLLILVELLRKIYLKSYIFSSILHSFPSNKSPPC